MKFSNLILIFILCGISCGKPDPCEKIHKDYRRTKNEFLSGIFNDKPLDMISKLIIELNKTSGVYTSYMTTQEFECQEEFINFVLNFDTLRIGEVNITYIRANSIRFKNEEYISKSYPDSVDTNYDHKIVFTKIGKNNLVEGYLQFKLYNSNIARRPSTTDEQNVYEFKDCQFSAIVKR